MKKTTNAGLLMGSVFVSLFLLSGFVFSKQAEAESGLATPKIEINNLEISPGSVNFGDTVKGSFAIENKDSSVASDLKYSISLLGDSNVIYKKEISPDKIMVSPGEVLKKEFSFKIDQELSGKFLLAVDLSQRNGVDIARQAAAIEIKGQDKSVAFLSDARINVDGTRFSEGAPLYAKYLDSNQSNIIIDYENKSEGQLNAIFSIKIFKDDSFLKPINDVEKVEGFVLMPKKSGTAAFNINKYKELGVYYAEINVTDENGNKISNSIYPTWVVAGDKAEILDILSDKKSCQKDEELNLTINARGFFGNFEGVPIDLDIQILDKNGKKIGESDSQMNIGSYAFSKQKVKCNNSADNLIIVAKISKDGTVLSEYRTDFSGNNDEKGTKNSVGSKQNQSKGKVAVIVFLALILIAVIAIVFKYRKSRNIALFFLFLFLAAISFQKASAVQVCANNGSTSYNAGTPCERCSTSSCGNWVKWQNYRGAACFSGVNEDWFNNRYLCHEAGKSYSLSCVNWSSNYSPSDLCTGQEMTERLIDNCGNTVETRTVIGNNPAHCQTNITVDSCDIPRGYYNACGTQFKIASKYNGTLYYRITRRNELIDGTWEESELYSSSVASDGKNSLPYISLGVTKPHPDGYGLICGVDTDFKVYNSDPRLGKAFLMASTSKAANFMYPGNNFTGWMTVNPSLLTGSLVPGGVVSFQVNFIRGNVADGSWGYADYEAKLYKDDGTVINWFSGRSNSSNNAKHPGAIVYGRWYTDTFSDKYLPSSLATGWYDVKMMYKSSLSGNTSTCPYGSGEGSLGSFYVPPAAPALSATLSASPLSGSKPLGVSFVASASGGTSPYFYTYTFGDGNTASGSANSTYYTYNNSGTYYPSVKVTDSVGNVATGNVIPSVAVSECTPDSSCVSHSVSWLGNCDGTCGGGSGTETGVCNNGCGGSGIKTQSCTNNTACPPGSSSNSWKEVAP